VAAKLMVEILGDSSSAVAAMGKTKTATAGATSATDKHSSSLATMAKAVATGYAVTKVVQFGKDTIQVAGDAMQANHRLEQTFRNAGDATGALAKHGEDLASSMGRQIGVSPTVIKNAEAMLTTFHAVSNETAVGAGIFDRATRAAADLAAAGFGDMSGNAKLLGKALQDPTQGMGALRRAGVNLSAAQQDQIKNMQKSGDLLGAQKMLLGEVEGQVKGTAAATAGSGAKMRVAYEEMQVSIGTALIPAIKVLRGELTGVFNFVSANASWLVPLIAGLTTLAVTVYTVSKAIQMFTLVWKGVQVAIAATKVAWLLLNVAFAASPLGVIIIGVMLVIGALVLLYLKVDWFRAFVNAAMAAIVAFFMAGWNAVVGIFNSVSSWLQGWGGLLVVLLTGPIGLAFVLINAFVHGGISGVLSMLSGWVSTIGSIVSPIVNIITAPFRAVWGVIYGVFIGPTISGISSLVGTIAGIMQGVISAITAPFQAAKNAVDSIIGGIKGAWNAVAHAINAVHVSFEIPSNPVTDFLHIGGKGFEWSPPFRLPVLQQGGLITRTGLVLAHAGEAITPIPPSRAGLFSDRPVVQIDHAHFSERIDVESFGRRLAWTMQTRVA